MFHEFYDQVKIKMNINREKISNLILATKYHSIDQFDFDLENKNNLINKHLNPKYSQEIKLFLDIDMYIFSENFEKYSENIDKIRMEFALFNDEDWKKGRLDFLKRINKRKRIYYTDIFNNKFEKVARENIKKDIEKMQNIISTIQKVL